MPRVPVPPRVDEFLREANFAVVGTLRADGSPHTVPSWYDWEGGRILLNVSARSQRLANVRRDPRVSVTVLDATTPYHHVSLLGRVAEIHDDPELADIDRLSSRYIGVPYPERGHASVSVWVEPERWHEFDASRALES